jgi:phosphoadenosine phosphosulfate reductase
VLVHLLKEQRPDISVIPRDRLPFPGTIEYRDQMTRDWNLNLVNLEAKQSVKEQESLFGILNQTEPSKCCGFRNVEPLFAGLANYDTWFTALRREQSPTRANLQEVEPFKLPVERRSKR